MKTATTKPIITKEVSFNFTKGIYNFFCKSTAKLFSVVFAVLSNITGFQVNGENAFSLVTCLWIVNHTANKLEGISSISTSVHDNLLCKCKQKIKDCICQFCYAYNQQSYQTGLKEHNIINGLVLKNVLLPVSALKRLSILFPYLRIESFGDVENTTQARNYLRIIKAFPKKRAVIFSKNPEIWKNAIEKEGKPNNCAYVHSSLFVNKADSVNLEKYPFIDHVFTVYTKKFAKEHNITINCGGRKCMECIIAKKNCFFRNTVFNINELKK